MREYGKVAPTFWTGKTGRLLRGDPNAQLVALYLITAPAATMTGVFYCPLIYIAKETGLSEEGASKGLRRASEVEFCTFDSTLDLVFVHEMARYQVGPSLKFSDKRVSGIRRDFDLMPNGLIKQAFYDRYRDAYHLPEWHLSPSPFEGASKAHRSQEQEQEQAQEVGLSHEPTYTDVSVGHCEIDQTDLKVRVIAGGRP